MSKREAKRAKDRRPAAAASPPRLARLWEWLDRHPVLFFVAVMALASVRIVSTYTVFNHTIDEPAHVACGTEWLQKGTYNYEPQHPPLARVAAAIGPYLMGRRGYGVTNMYQEGALVLYADNHYDRNLALARLGILPFFWVASVVVYIWGRGYFGSRVAAVALVLFSFLPPVLAHAGLATTDMALTAFVGASFLTGVFWFEKPSMGRAAVFGISTGLAVLSKFSSLPFIPCAFLAFLVWYLWMNRPGGWTILAAVRARILPFCLAVLAGAVVIWAGYRFSVGKPYFSNLVVPAPALFNGTAAVIGHDLQGHSSYLLGMHSKHGWWYYYPVVLAVKTPLPFLAFLFFGIAVIWKKKGTEKTTLGMPMAFSAGILILALFSSINIGVRHILPVYIGFSLVAAIGAVRLFEMAREMKWAAWVLGVASIWYAGTSLASHPDYIPYFNFLAGAHPEDIVADSDLDWGQDMKRLGRKLREVGAREVTFDPFIIAYLERVHGFPPIHGMDPTTPSPGWNAVSLTVLKVARLGLEDSEPNLQLWPEQIPPTTRVGKTTLLWYFPPGRGLGPAHPK